MHNMCNFKHIFYSSGSRAIFFFFRISFQSLSLLIIVFIHSEMVKDAIVSWHIISIILSHAHLVCIELRAFCFLIFTNNKRITFIKIKTFIILHNVHSTYRTYYVDVNNFQGSKNYVQKNIQ